MMSEHKSESLGGLEELEEHGVMHPACVVERAAVRTQKFVSFGIGELCPHIVLRVEQARRPSATPAFVYITAEKAVEH